MSSDIAVVVGRNIVSKIIEMDVKHRLRKLLKTAIAKGWSVNRISQISEVDQAALQRFVSDANRDLSLTSAERLMEFFSVEISGGQVPDPGE